MFAIQARDLYVMAVNFAVLSIMLLTIAPAKAAFTPARFSVVVEGNDKGPDVILIPGLGCSRNVYSAEAKLLAATYHLHLVQLAGFAGSPAGQNATGPILKPFVEELHQYIVKNGLSHPAVMGHSLGGLIALMLADAHADDVGKLIVIDALPFYGMIYGPKVTVEMLSIQANAIHEMMMNLTEDQFARYEAQYAVRLASSRDGQTLAYSAVVTSDRRVLLNALREDLQTDIRSRLPSIKTATTVIYPYSADDGSTAKVDNLYKGAYAAMSSVHMVRVDNSRHFIMQDQPDAFDRIIKEILANLVNIDSAKPGAFQNRTVEAGIVLDAIDDRARDWYLGLNFGFKTLQDDPRHLYIGMETIRQLG